MWYSDLLGHMVETVRMDRERASVVNCHYISSGYFVRHWKVPSGFSLCFTRSRTSPPGRTSFIAPLGNSRVRCANPVRAFSWLVSFMIMSRSGPGRCQAFSCFSLTDTRSEEHTSELQSLLRISYTVFCLKKKK